MNANNNFSVVGFICKDAEVSLTESSIHLSCYTY